MALLKIAKLGNPILRKISEPVTKEECLTPEFQQFIDDMIETMQKEDGIGLSAPQVSRSKQLVVLQSQMNPRYPNEPDLPLLVLMNPRLTLQSDEWVEGWEGCLSVTNLRGKVKRCARLHVSGFDRKMEAVSFDAEGFLSVVLQHETDHLIGKVFLDRMEGFSTLTHLEEFERHWMSEQAKV